MLYDVKAHVPGLMENFLEEYRNGELEKILRTKTALIQVLKDTDAERKIPLVEVEKKKQYKKIDEDAIKSLTGIVNGENMDKIWEDVHKTYAEYVQAAEKIETDYWETLISVFRNTINGIKTPNMNE